MASYRWTERPLGDAMVQRLKNLLGVFVAGVLYFVIVYHLTNLYSTRLHGVERFFLLEGGIYTQLFWFGQILIGSLVPLFLLYHPRLGKSRTMIGLASVLVILGGLVQMYVILIGGQAYPLVLFPGKEVIEGGFFEGSVATYNPSLWEFLLGIGGLAFALLMVAIAVKVLRFLPNNLDDAHVDPHHGAEKAS